MRLTVVIVFFFNDTATTEIYTLSLHDALPIFPYRVKLLAAGDTGFASAKTYDLEVYAPGVDKWLEVGSEEHTSELQSRQYLVCRLLLEKKNKQRQTIPRSRHTSCIQYSSVLPH